MSVYKEGWYCLKVLDEVKMRTDLKKGDKYWNAAKQLVEWYGVPETRQLVTAKDGSSASVTCEVELIMEGDTPVKKRFMIASVVNRNGQMAIVYVDITKK